MSTNTNEPVSHSDADALRNLFVGRSIQSVEGETLTLDDGTRLRIEANEGCGGCTDGWFQIMKTEGFQNRIMNVEVVERGVMAEESADEEWMRSLAWLNSPFRGDYRPAEVFELFVYGSGPGEEGSLIAQVAGDIGNGYYGWGFKIRVISEN
jgi:hypothetical protein